MSERRKSIIIKNIGFDCREEDLRRPFEELGPIKSIYIPNRNGGSRAFAFIKYEVAADAAEAIQIFFTVVSWLLNTQNMVG